MQSKVALRWALASSATSSAMMLAPASGDRPQFPIPRSALRRDGSDTRGARQRDRESGSAAAPRIRPVRAARSLLHQPIPTRRAGVGCPRSSLRSLGQAGVLAPRALPPQRWDIPALGLDVARARPALRALVALDRAGDHLLGRRETTGAQAWPAGVAPALGGRVAA